MNFDFLKKIISGIYLEFTAIKCSQPAFIYSKLAIETLEQGVKYGQS